MGIFAPALTKQALDSKLSDYSTPEKQAHLKAFGLTKYDLLVTAASMFTPTTHHRVISHSKKSLGAEQTITQTTRSGAYSIVSGSFIRLTQQTI